MTRAFWGQVAEKAMLDAVKKSTAKGPESWSVYIARCADSTLYTGIARDVARRLEAHNSGKGAKYTRHRAPIKLIYRETCATRGEAQCREYEIKQMSRQQKLDLNNDG